MKRMLRLAVALCLFAGTAALQGVAQEANTAQAPPAKAMQTTPARNPNGTFMTQRTASTQNLAKAEQEDEEYVFKHSSSVRAFGKFFHLGPDAASLCFWGLNFAILAVLVGLGLYKGLPKAFRGRRALIEQQLVEARAVTEQANERLRIVEERLSRLDTEIASIREGAERDSAHDEERIKASIEEERRKIVASAEQEVTAAGAAAERRLRRFAAELAVDRATARIHLSADDDRRLIRAFAAGISGNGGGGNGGGGNGRSGGRG